MHAPLTDSNLSSTSRIELLRQFLANCPSGLGLQPDTLQGASADASFRRYFRLQGAGATCIVMDAPPSHEDCRPFVHVAGLLAQAGVQVPKVLAANLTDGFLLLTDLGTRTYLAELTPANAPRLYADATASLIKLQTGSPINQLPAYDREKLLRELQLFPDWYLGRHLNCPPDSAQQAVLRNAFETIITVNLAEPVVAVHRDFHSRNLMVTEQNNPGVLDFQDAVAGPISYDLASLLRDAYIQWPEEHQLDWAIRYWERARNAGLPVRPDFADFWRDFEFMGLQRHLKILGIFARLNYRDGKDGYLKDLPLVAHYVREVLQRYGALRPLLRLLDQTRALEPASAS
jgi:aminoglycoside/choline kinase family phosphotransferase